MFTLSYRNAGPAGLLGALLLAAAAGQATNRPEFAAGSDAGAGSLRAYDLAQGIVHDLQPFGSGFSGGVRVALGDLDGDGIPELFAASGGGMQASVALFDGASGGFIDLLLPYGAFTGGVNVAAGDVNGDGVADIITGAGPGGGPRVRVFSGRDLALLHDFDAYDPAFRGGVNVAAGDVDGDGRADLVTAPASAAGPHVRVFSGGSGAVLRDFLAYSPSFTGGVSVAAGDWDGDGDAEVITGAGPGGGPHVKVFDAASGAELASFLAYSPNFTGGVRVAAGDLDGDGRADLITASGPGIAAQLVAFRAGDNARIAELLPFDSAFSGGIHVAAAAVPVDPRLFGNGFEN